MKKYIIQPLPSRGMEEMGMGVEVIVKKLDYHEESKQLVDVIDSALKSIRPKFKIHINIKEYNKTKEENV